VALAAIVTALATLGYGVAASVEQRRSRRRPPPRPRPGARALDARQRGGTGHRPGRNGPRSGQDRADLRVHQPHPAPA
jgi:hypothetical protein